MPKIFTSKNQKIGQLGENIATRFLVKRGFKILERNYTKPWGELDIIAKKSNKLYFIEVKSVTRNIQKCCYTNNIVDNYRPEDNMHPWKIKRLKRTIQTYLASHNLNEDIDFQTDLFLVFIDPKNKKSKIKLVKDIIL